MAMDTRSAQQFIAALENNSSLQTQFSIAAPNNLDAVVDFADAKGFTFTHEELEAALKNHPNSAIAEQLRSYVH